jgi:hypothetical protein
MRGFFFRPSKLRILPIFFSTIHATTPIRIVPSISKLFILRKEASEIYTSGSISEEHFQFAMQRIDELVSKFRKEMFLRLHDYILTNKGKGVLSEDDLRRYLTGEYIDFDSYKILMEVVKK